jgi:hypothetical protein
MKYSLFLLFTFTTILLDVASCGCSRHDYDDVLNVSSNRVILESQKGASSEIFISSNLHWTIYNNGESWLTVSPGSGNNDAKIIVTALSANESLYERTCTIIIEGDAGPESIKREIIVIQRGQ